MNPPAGGYNSTIDELDWATCEEDVALPSALIVLPDGSAEFVEFPEPTDIAAAARSLALGVTAGTVLKEHPRCQLFHDSAWTKQIRPSDALSPGATYYLSPASDGAGSREGGRGLISLVDCSVPLRLRPSASSSISAAALAIDDEDLAFDDSYSPATPSLPVAKRDGLRASHEIEAAHLPDWMVQRQQQLENELSWQLHKQRLDEPSEATKESLESSWLEVNAGSTWHRTHASASPQSPASPLSRMATGSSWSSTKSPGSCDESGRVVSPMGKGKGWFAGGAQDKRYGTPGANVTCGVNWARAMGQLQGKLVQGKQVSLMRLESGEERVSPQCSPPAVASTDNTPCGHVDLLSVGLSLGLQFCHVEERPRNTRPASAVEARPNGAAPQVPQPCGSAMQHSLPEWATKMEMVDEWADSPPTSDLEDVLEFARSRRDRRKLLHGGFGDRVTPALAEKEHLRKAWSHGGTPVDADAVTERSRGSSDSMKRNNRSLTSLSLFQGAEGPQENKLKASATSGGKVAAGVPLPPSRMRRAFSIVDKCAQEKVQGKQESVRSGVLSRIHMRSSGRGRQRTSRPRVTQAAAEEAPSAGFDGIDLPTCLDLDVLCKEGSIFTDS